MKTIKSMHAYVMRSYPIIYMWLIVPFIFVPIEWHQLHKVNLLSVFVTIMVIAAIVDVLRNHKKK